MEIKVTLTEAEAKAMAYVAYDVSEWVQNAVSARASAAMDEIFQMEIQRMLADPETTEIPADRETIVLQADIKSAAERQMEASLNGTGLS